MMLINMELLNAEQLLQAARILTDSLPQGWPGLGDAEREIVERLTPENLLLAALKDDRLLGWGGILPAYDGRAFELHPLVVRADARRTGIGSALVAALEASAKTLGARTIYLGADDQRDGGETSLAGKDLYQDIPGYIRSFEPGTHASAFYLKLGYRVVGVLPDAGGPGRPDIFLAKRL